MFPLKALFLVSISVLCFAQVPVLNSDAEYYAEQQVVHGFTPGLVIGLVNEHGTTFFARGVTKKGGAPVTQESVFEIGALTKVFTASMLMIQDHNDMLSLEDPISAILPGNSLSYQGEAMKFYHLATHSSGLPRGPSNLRSKNKSDPYADYTGAQLEAFIQGFQLNRMPGELYDYSNVGMGLLGHLLCKVEGKSYDAVVKQLIAKPLGMNMTGTDVTSFEKKHQTRGHKEGFSVPGWHYDAMSGAGALHSSAADLLKFLSVQMGLEKHPLNDVFKKMHEKRVDTPAAGTAVGMGWHLAEQYGATLVWQNGQTGGYHAFMGFHPDKKLGVVILGNSTNNLDILGFHLLESQYKLPPIQIRPSDAVLDDALGFYQLTPGIVLEITRKGNLLYSKFPEQPALPLYATSEYEYFYKVIDAKVRFGLGENGKINAIHLTDRGREVVGPKLPKDYKPRKMPKVIALSEEVLREYAGTYRFAAGLNLEMKIIEGELQARLGDQPFLPLYPSAKDEFFYKVVDARITFNRSESGVLEGLTLYQAGMSQLAVRLPD